MQVYFLPSILMGKVMWSGSSFSQLICGAGTPSFTTHVNVTVPSTSVSPSHKHTGKDGGTTPNTAPSSKPGICYIYTTCITPSNLENQRSLMTIKGAGCTPSKCWGNNMHSLMVTSRSGVSHSFHRNQALNGSYPGLWGRVLRFQGPLSLVDCSPRNDRCQYQKHAFHSGWYQRSRACQQTPPCRWRRGFWSPAPDHTRSPGVRG